MNGRYECSGKTRRSYRNALAVQHDSRSYPFTPLLAPTIRTLARLLYNHRVIGRKEHAPLEPQQRFHNADPQCPLQVVAVHRKQVVLRHHANDHVTSAVSELFVSLG